jgi:hypothetical protein
LPRDVIGPTPNEGCQRLSRGGTAAVLCPDYRTGGEIRAEIHSEAPGYLVSSTASLRPSDFLPLWERFGVDLRDAYRGRDVAGGPRAEIFRCERYRYGGALGAQGTLCTQTVYDVPRINATASLVAFQRDEDGVLMVAFGVSDTASFKARVFQGAQIAARSFEFEGYLRDPRELQRGVASYGNFPAAPARSAR